MKWVNNQHFLPRIYNAVIVVVVVAILKCIIVQSFLCNICV